jgi:hypothetical protein
LIETPPAYFPAEASRLMQVNFFRASKSCGVFAAARFGLSRLSVPRYGHHETVCMYPSHVPRRLASKGGNNVPACASLWMNVMMRRPVRQHPAQPPRRIQHVPWPECLSPDADE